MRNFINKMVYCTLKHKRQALYVILFLAILFGVIFFSKSMFGVGEKEKIMLKFFNKAEISKSETMKSQKIIESETKNLEKNFELLDCYILQMERVVEGLEVVEGYCELKFGESPEVEKKFDEIAKVEGVVKEENIEKKVEEKKEWSVYRHEWNDERNDWLSYMYEKSGFDRDMILTFLSENDNMGLNRPSNETGKDGNRAYGICQLYYTYHKDFIDSPDFDNPYIQMDYCMGVWNDAKKRGILKTTFYAYNFRYNAAKKVVFVK